jgi:hypothetical protein
MVLCDLRHGSRGSTRIPTSVHLVPSPLAKHTKESGFLDVVTGYLPWAGEAKSVEAPRRMGISTILSLAIRSSGRDPDHSHVPHLRNAIPMVFFRPVRKLLRTVRFLHLVNSKRVLSVTSSSS